MKYIILLSLFLIPSIASAVEGSLSVYPAGIISPQAGMIPEAGSYFGLDFYSYTGEVSKTSRAGRLYVDAEINISSELLSYTYVAKGKVGKATPFFSAYLPYTNVELDGNVTGNFPSLGSVVNHEFDKSSGSIGDSSIASGLGWHYDYFHYSAFVNAYAPTGAYDKDAILNVGLNRWAVQPMVAFTYLNEKNGFEFSSALGYTVNFENNDTDYNSGDELNFELAVIQHFTKYLNLGLVGYGNQQITGDSGEGAILGEFKGQVYGAGFNLGITAPMTEENTLSFNLRYYNEFNAIHRFDGDTLYLSGALNF